MATMTAWRIHEFGGPEVLRLDTLEIPEPQPDEVRIRVYASSVNPVDFKTRSGKYPAITREQLPTVLGRDVAGVVERVGSETRGLKVNNAVYALLDNEHGGFAQYVVLKAALCATKPSRLEYAEAAAVPLAALTAWQGLFDHGDLKPEQQVLIHGGAGGVGHLAIQLAKAKGARVITTVDSNDKEFVRQLGADQVIDYKSERFEERVRNVDVVFDLVGGETQQRSWSVLKQGGVLVSTLGKPADDMARKHHARAAGYLAQPDAAQLKQIAELIDQGKVRPIVQATYPLAQLAEAQLRVEREHTRGKVVVIAAT